MPIFMIIDLDVFIIMRFSINCSAVICSPTVIHAISREATSETYGPRVSFSLYCISFPYYRILFTTFQSLLSNLYIKNTKNIYFIISTRSHFCEWREGIDNPFIASVASSWLFVQVHGDLCIVSYWIDTLVLKTEGNTYATLPHHPFLFKGIPMHALVVAVAPSTVTHITLYRFQLRAHIIIHA